MGSLHIDERFGPPVFGELKDFDLTVGLINIIDFGFSIDLSLLQS